MPKFPPYLPLANLADRLMAVDALIDAGENALAEQVRNLPADDTQAVLVNGEEIRDSYLEAAIQERDGVEVIAALAHGDDLATIWEHLEPDDRDWLVEKQIIAQVQPEVTVSDQQNFVDNWQPESNAAWPTYVLEVSADGMPEPLVLVGWHLVGADGNASDDDGSETGIPRLDRQSGWVVRSGAYVGQDAMISVWQAGDGWVTLDRDALAEAIQQAADSVDHGDAPTWDEVPPGEINEVDSEVYIVLQGQVVEVAILSGGLLPYDTDRAGRMPWEDRTVTAYNVEAWAFSCATHMLPGEGEFYGDRRDVLRVLKEDSDDGQVYQSEEEARESDDYVEPEEKTEEG